MVEEVEPLSYVVDCVEIILQLPAMPAPGVCDDRLEQPLKSRPLLDIRFERRSVADDRARSVLRRLDRARLAAQQLLIKRRTSLESAASPDVLKTRRVAEP